MKIIIMTGRFGMGHFMAAQAIKKILDNSPVAAEIEIIDWLEYATPKYAGQLYRLFGFAVNNVSKLYNQRYKWLENKRTNRKPELYHYFMKQFTKFLMEKQPDIIISTLPVCSQVVSWYKEKMQSNLPLITCVTDITGHSEWISRKTDLYFVGSGIVKEKLVSKGVPLKQIYITGIPVNPLFDNVPLNKTDVCEPKSRNILVMGGGLGMLPGNTEFYENLSQLTNTKVTVITGQNTELYGKLSGRYDNLKAVGFVHNVYEYMREADMIVSKPGGITTFEAINAEVPIIALNPVLQQELYNAEFIHEVQIGTVIEGNTSECLIDIERLLLDGNQLRIYKDNMKKLKNKFAENKLDGIVIRFLKETTCQFGRKPLTEYYASGKEIILHEKVNFNL